MKKILFPLILLLIIVLTGCAKKPVKTNYDKIIERDILIVGVKNDSKPLGFINNKGELDGLDIDIAKYIAKDILGSDRKIKFIPVTPNTKVEAVTSGEVDMVIAAMSVTPQRQYFVDFSEPYYIAGQSALVKEDSNIYNFADLKKKKIIVVLGTTAEKNIRRIIPTASLIGYKNYTEAFNAFKAGEGDAISTDNTILSGFLMDNPEYRMLKNRISQEPYAIAVKQEDNPKLKRNLNIIINRITTDGTIKDFKKKWNLR